MKKIVCIALSCLLFGALNAQEIGVVNFSTLLAESKLGKQEQKSFDDLKDQMTALVEDTQKQMQELSQKLNDPDYMDGLSPEGEAELKGQIQAKGQELSQYQNQYYQVLNQQNMRVYQLLSATAGQAAEQVAKNKKLALVLNKEAAFYVSPDLDITDDVKAEMDRLFDKQDKAKKQEK